MTKKDLHSISLDLDLKLMGEGKSTMGLSVVKIIMPIFDAYFLLSKISPKMNPIKID